MNRKLNITTARDVLKLLAMKFNAKTQRREAAKKNLAWRLCVFAPLR
jgi:hypothetical protein